MSNLKRVLFVCHANSVRSPMAEGLGKELGEGLIASRSAGFFPGGVHPLAVIVMREIGIDISGHRSRQLNDYILAETDYLITCTDSAGSLIGELPERIEYINWPIVNPDSLVCSQNSQEQAYANCRDDLKKRIENLLNDIG